MITVHKIALDPNNKQRTYFSKAAGVARFAYNWALAEWQRQHKAGEKPNEVKLRRELNALKRSQFPWMLEVTKAAPQQAIKNLGKGYAKAFKNVKIGRKRGKKNPYGFPVFKKKGVHDSFRADNGPDKKHPNAVEVEGKKVKLPVIGWIRMREKLRFDGVIKSAVVSREADRWFVALSIEVESQDTRSAVAVIGVDLGVKDLAVVSDGRRFKASKSLKQNLRRLRRANKELSRRKKKSANWLKTKAKLAKIHSRISNLRKDCLHKATTDIVRSAGVIVLEDLNVSGMMANGKLSRAIADVGLYEFRRQVEYKAERSGARVIIANRWFPSSKTCSACGCIKDKLPLNIREWTCEHCGAHHDRDLNAAINLRNLAASSAVAACGENSADDELAPIVKLASVKQEFSGIAAYEQLCVGL